VLHWCLLIHASRIVLKWSLALAAHPHAVTSAPMFHTGWMDTSMYAPQTQVDVALTDAKCKQYRQRSDLELRELDLAHRRTQTTRFVDSLDAAAMAAAAPAPGDAMMSRPGAGGSMRGTQSSAGGGSPGRSGMGSSKALLGGPSSPSSQQQQSLVQQMAGCTLRSCGPTAAIRIMKAARPAVEAAKQQLGLLSGSGR
jgi:hypothetical protein